MLKLVHNQTSQNDVALKDGCVLAPSKWASSKSNLIMISQVAKSLIMLLINPTQDEEKLSPLNRKRKPIPLQMNFKINTCSLLQNL